MMPSSHPVLFGLIVLLVSCNPAKKVNRELNFALQDLHVLAARISSMDPMNEEVDLIDSLEWKLFMQTAFLLQDPLFPKEKLSEIPLPQVQSYDTRVTAFNQFVNSGGSWREFRSLIYIDNKNQPADVLPHYSYASGAIEDLYLLPGTQKEQYLALSSTQTCTTCYSGSAFIIDMATDSVQFNPVIEMECRRPLLDFFRYNPGQRTLEYRYTLMPDDLFEYPYPPTQFSQEGYPIFSDTLRWEAGSFQGLE